MKRDKFHSQGSGVLTQLIKNEIDGKPVQERLISALLLGTNLAAPKGKDVGGAFKNVPLCRAASQTGCAIAYVTFRADAPPPANSLFGRIPGDTLAAACTNPAALGGGNGPLHAYLGTGRSGSSAEPRPWVTPPQAINTPFVSAGVTDRVKFLQQDLFEMDFREATLVTLYLLQRLNIQLRPKLLRELKPGARIVSHAFDMGDWVPDKVVTAPGGDDERTIYYAALVIFQVSFIFRQPLPPMCWSY